MYEPNKISFDEELVVKEINVPCIGMPFIG